MCTFSKAPPDWRGEKLSLTGFGVRPVSIDEGAKPPSVRRGAHAPAGLPDPRSPELVIGPGSKGICALTAHSEVRRPSVGRSCGVRRPAHNKRDLEVEGKFWIQRDGTEYSIAQELLDAGVQKDRIVLAFRSPEMRRMTDFAVA